MKQRPHPLDRSNMLKKIVEFPQHLIKGWDIPRDFLPEYRRCDYQNMVFGGMGGSAIAGDIVYSIFNDQLTVPFIVNRQYQLPSFVDDHTLFIASSYSGNTEETLAALEEAEKKSCAIVCVTSGGHLASRAAEKGYPLFLLPPGYPPRAALGFSLGVFFRLFEAWGFGSLSRQDLTETVSFLEACGREWSLIDNPENLAFTLARMIHKRLPVIYSSAGAVSSVGFRWKTQLNENSKVHAFYQPFPEMNHNEIMGWARLKETASILSKLIIVFLKLPDDAERIAIRMNITKKMLEEDAVDVVEIVGEGPSFLSRILYLVHLGDFVSYALAVLNNVDPTEIGYIDRLKEKLAKSS